MQVISLRSLVSACCAYLALGSLPASAQDSGVVFAGGGVSDGYNAYAGVVVALPGNALGDGLAVRASTGGGQYRYDSAGQEIEASYLSGEIALVYQLSGEWGWANFGVGPRLSHNETEPLDPGNDNEGTSLDAAFSTDGALGNRWRLGWYGAVGLGDETYAAELRFGPLLDEASQTRIGVEAGVQGDENYTRGALGLFVSRQLGGQIEGRLSGGFSEQRGRSAEP